MVYLVSKHPRSKVNYHFVILSSDLRPHVLDTQVRTAAELATDHHLVVSWVRWQGSFWTDLVNLNM